MIWKDFSSISYYNLKRSPTTSHKLCSTNGGDRSFISIQQLMHQRTLQDILEIPSLEPGLTQSINSLNSKLGGIGFAIPLYPLHSIWAHFIAIPNYFSFKAKQGGHHILLNHKGDQYDKDKPKGRSHKFFLLDFSNW